MDTATYNALTERMSAYRDHGFKVDTFAGAFSLPGGEVDQMHSRRADELTLTTAESIVGRTIKPGGEMGHANYAAVFAALKRYVIKNGAAA